MPGYKTARRTIGRLPAGRPTTGIIIVWRRIESQSGNNRESMALPCIDSDPFAASPRPQVHTRQCRSNHNRHRKMIGDRLRIGTASSEVDLQPKSLV
jgi:hypothetical protein